MYVLHFLCYYNLMKTKQEVFNYIQSTTNWNIVSIELNFNIPLYIKVGYELWSARLEEVDVLLVKVKEQNSDIRLHQNVVKKLEELSSLKIILVFEKLDTRSADSFIKKNISFIVKDKQIFIPFALIQVKTNNQKNIRVKSTHLSIDADVILVAYLNNMISSNMIIKDISNLIYRGSRETSQALNVLESLEYIKIETQGRNKQIEFISQSEVYERLKEESIPLVKYIFFSKEIFDNPIYSGFTALSKYSSVMDEKIQTFAIHEKQINKKDLELLKCDEEDAKYKIEVWNRDPFILSLNNAINPVYILRLLNSVDDERTQDAVRQIEENIIKKFKDINERD